jgi:hypothetical protein
MEKDLIAIIDRDHLDPGNIPLKHSLDLLLKICSLYNVSLLNHSEISFYHDFIPSNPGVVVPLKMLLSFIKNLLHDRPTLAALLHARMEAWQRDNEELRRKVETAQQGLEESWNQVSN